MSFFILVSCSEMIGAKQEARHHDDSDVSRLNDVVTDADKLLVPPLLEADDQDVFSSHFQLTAQQSTTTFIEKTETHTRGYNGNYLGPVLKVRRGEEVRLKLTTRWMKRRRCTGMV